AAGHSLERHRDHLGDLPQTRHRVARVLHRSRPGDPFRLSDGADPGLDLGDDDGGLALDAAGRAAGLCRVALDPGCLLPGRQDRRRVEMGGLPLHPAAEDARRADHRDPAAIHGQLPDLHGALRPDRRRSRRFDDVPVHLPRQAGGGGVRRRQGRGLLDHLFPERAGLQLRLLSGAAAGGPGRSQMRIRGDVIGLVVYLAILLLPIYWMLNMSLRDNNDIMSQMALYPSHPNLHNYVVIFTDPAWYWGYINSFAYVSINTVISVTVALPAAYAFSRYRFLGDKHLFFWLL